MSNKDGLKGLCALLALCLIGVIIFTYASTNLNLCDSVLSALFFTSFYALACVWIGVLACLTYPAYKIWQLQYNAVIRSALEVCYVVSAIFVMLLLGDVYLSMQVGCVESGKVYHDSAFCKSIGERSKVSVVFSRDVEYMKVERCEDCCD